ncbi:basic leucine zipper protein [Colletotrichum tofieldiae]|nr:basic leucine zipper protein [Colletotrichum tofieldiae]
MPRDGSGASDNAIEAGHNIVHGAGFSRRPCRQDRAPPEGEKGLAIDGLNASGGQSQGLAQGPNVGQGGRGSSN